MQVACAFGLDLSCAQVLLAAGVGAEYAAPYLGRMILKGKDALQDIQDMQVPLSHH